MEVEPPDPASPPRNPPRIPPPGGSLEPPGGAVALPDGPPPPARRPNVRVLLAFLGAYLLLILVFREVLFPFLIAIFLAYLIEPVVRWVKQKRLFGIDWGRGPIVVVLYGVFVGLLAFLAWKGVTKAATAVKRGARELSATLREEGGRARLLVDRSRPSPHALHVPAGTPLVFTAGDHSIAYRTLHAVDVPSEASEADVLLEMDPAPPEVRRPQEGEALRFAEADGPRWTGGGEAAPPPYTLVAARRPEGLEIAFERRVVGPLVSNLAARGLDVEPTDLRSFISVKAQALAVDLPDRLTKGAIQLAGKIVLSVYEFFLILMIAAFIIMDRRRIATFFSALPPPAYKPAYERLMRYVDDGLAGVIRGQLMICLVNGVLTWLGLVLLGVKGAAPLGALAAVLSLIPIFGTIVSTVPIFVVAATDSLDKGVLALLWIVFIHMLEANMINPLVMGSHARMHPVVIVFALLAGEHAFGVWGALLAVPTASLVQSCFLFYLHEVERLPPAPPDNPHGGGLKRLWKRLMPGGRAKTTT